MANEHSNIVPNMSPTAKVSDFKFWCQKVLPLVYDDSLSYYEVLNKLVVYLNQVIANVNADIDNVEELESDFLLLQSYVNNFFDDIDQLVSYAERAEAAETSALSYAASAAESATNASTSALNAMDAKDAAVIAKNQAQAALTNAQTAATNAAASATAADTSATNAAASATSASGYATNASASATAAQNSFTLADAARSAAQTAATNADASATAAAGSATDAASSATAAATSAASADGEKAQEMISESEEESTTAASEHNIGTYFRLNGVLYRATDNIQIGDTISTSTNCEEIHVDEVLTAQSEQIGELKTSLDNTVVEFNNGFYPYSIVKGRYINTSTRKISNYSAWDGTDFIDISGLDKIVVVNTGSSGTPYNGFFASKTDDTAISTFSVHGNQPNGEVFTVPSGANYVILSHYVADLPKMHIVDKTGINLRELNADSADQEKTNTLVQKQINLTNKNFNLDGNYYFNPTEFELGKITTSGFETQKKRIASRKVFQFKKVVTIKCAGTYKVFLSYTDSNGTYISAVDWTNEVSVPVNQYFMIMVSPTGGEDGADLSVELIPDYLSNVSMQFRTSFKYNGAVLFPEQHGFYATQLDITPNERMLNNSQGLAIYGNTLFQICDSGNNAKYIDLVNLETGAITEITADSAMGHGDSAFFLDEFYDQSDEYPLLCIGSNVFRINNGNATIVRHFNLTNDAGYMVKTCYDKNANCLLGVGYSNNDFETDANNNKTIISAYNLNKLTEVSTDVYAPELIFSYELPFIYCVQSVKFYNGLIIALSSYDINVQKSWIYFINPYTRQITAIIKDLPYYLRERELEGVDIINDEWLLVSTRQRYFRLDFES